ncbi:MAG: hypothetical protein QXL58_03210, partial [Candidatus Hadarchaeales archaeon]
HPPPHFFLNSTQHPPLWKGEKKREKGREDSAAATRSSGFFLGLLLFGSLLLRHGIPPPFEVEMVHNLGFSFGERAKSLPSGL